MGQLKSMVFDLADLRTIKPAVELFLTQESRLDVLFNNAAVMNPPADSKSAQVSLPSENDVRKYAIDTQH